MQKREEHTSPPELVERHTASTSSISAKEIETRPWTIRLLTFRFLYFLLGFWCGVIAILLVLLTISTFYGWA